MIGNDIVDLSLEETFGKEGDRRFLERALHPEEMSDLDLAEDPKLLLWSLWSAKETAYKIWKKLDSRLIFSPRNFRVRSPLKSPSRVEWRGRQAAVRWEYGEGWIHCVGLDGHSTGGLGRARIAVGSERGPSPSDGELPPSRASAAVRGLAVEILGELGVRHVKIVRRPQGNRYGPPEIFSRGRPVTEFDLSLSHHGRFFAAAVLPLRE